MCRLGRLPVTFVFIFSCIVLVHQVNGGDTDRNFPWSNMNRGLSRDFQSEESKSGVSWDGRLVAASDNNLDETSNTAKDASEEEKPALFKYVKKKGRIALNISPRPPGITKLNKGRIFKSVNSGDVTAAIPTIRYPQEKETLSISVDPFASLRLLRILYIASSSFMAAFIGTLKLLGPMIFARRVLAQMGEIVSDYMMGRYLRTTYDHIQRKYWKEYQGPAASRSLGRSLAHMAILLQLGVFMEKWLSLGSQPCVIAGTGACHWWCGLLWILSVIGTGNIGAVLVSTLRYVGVVVL